MTQDIAILHDQFRTMGGAERVAVEIARTFDAPIYTLRHDDGVGPADVDIRTLNGKWGKWLMRRHYQIQDLYQMLRWQHDSELYEYDTLIETKTNPYWFVPHADSQQVIRYLHSTPRNMYDQFKRRGGHPLTNTLMTVQRMLYQHTLPYADAWIANSDIVARRSRMYFNIDPDHVIYPPVDVSKASPHRAETQDIILAIGRLAVNKRVGLLRDVAERVDVPVHVAGDGPMRDELLDGAPDNLYYHGYVDEEAKWQLMSEAGATLMLAENEDFGIVPIESMASGTPVIGVREGFTEYQIQHGQNGLLVEPDVGEIHDAIKRFQRDGVGWSDDQIAAYAQQFGTERFREEFRALVASVTEETAIQPRLEVPPAETPVIADGGE